MSDTIAAIATGSQLAAIGIVRLSGDGAIDVTEKIFRPHSGLALSSYPDRQLVYGSLIGADGGTIDLCLCTISRAPHSYTGENTAELQCHGSPTVLRMALDSLFAAGARQALAGEFTKRAFLNGRMDLTQAEAVIDLINAETEECAKNAAGQLGGAILRRTGMIYSTLADIASHYHAVLDYPDEEIEDFRLDSYKSTLSDAAASLRTLLDSFKRGNIMSHGLRAAILGRPNAGKSSLLNALLGYNRAIVTDIPGTTRDTIEERVQLGGILLRLSDTAGLRGTDDPVEKIGVERAVSAAERSSLIFAVFDGSQPFTDEDREVAAAALKCPASIAVVNKCDLSARLDESLLKDFKSTVRVSALDRTGLETLDAAVAELFPQDTLVPDGEILTNSRHADAVSRAHSSLDAALDAMETGITPDAVLTEIEAAMSALGELSGRTVREDITARIFERFCVGK